VEYDKEQESQILTLHADQHNLWLDSINENRYLSEGAEQKVKWLGAKV